MPLLYRSRVRSMRLLADQLVVLCMCTDPEPEYAVFNVSTKRAVSVSDSR